MSTEFRLNGGLRPSYITTEFRLLLNTRILFVASEESNLIVFNSSATEFPVSPVPSFQCYASTVFHIPRTLYYEVGQVWFLQGSTPWYFKLYLLDLCSSFVQCCHYFCFILPFCQVSKIVVFSSLALLPSVRTHLFSTYTSHALPPSPRI